MNDLKLSELAEKIAAIDFAMLVTQTDGGHIASRPMSNNGEVSQTGDCWFFTWESSRMVADIEMSSHVGLTYQGSSNTGGKPPIFIAVNGKARIIRDASQFAAHWNEGLNRWFTDGPRTAGMVMLHVQAHRVHYWDGENEGGLAV